jgi:hypothetical protein
MTVLLDITLSNEMKKNSKAKFTFIIEHIKIKNVDNAAYPAGML